MTEAGVLCHCRMAGLGLSRPHRLYCGAHPRRPAHETATAMRAQARAPRSPAGRRREPARGGGGAPGSTASSVRQGSVSDRDEGKTTHAPRLPATAAPAAAEGTLQTGQTRTLGEVGRHCPVGPSGHASPPVEDLWPRREKRDGDKGFILRR